MIVNQTFPASADSAIIDFSLVPIMPVESLFPVVTGNSNQGQGSGPNTLASPSMSGSAVSNTAQPVQTGGALASMTGSPLSEAASSIATTLGIPTMLFWVIALGAIGYLVLWHVHFHMGISD